MRAVDEFQVWLARMTLAEDVVGVVLSGSHAVGLATERSDYDLLVVTKDGAEQGLAGEARRDARLDVSVMPLRKFRVDALPGSGTEFYRYVYAHAQVLKDTPDALIAGLVRAKSTLTDEEAAALMPDTLDGFLNCTYRAMKDDRDGHALAARLDAVDAVPGYLTYVFALHLRSRPYNKYLAWELEHHPLGTGPFESAHLLGLLDRVASPDPVPALRTMVREIEPYARAAGHGGVLDGWGADLAFMRG